MIFNVLVPFSDDEYEDDEELEDEEEDEDEEETESKTASMARPRRMSEVKMSDDNQPMPDASSMFVFSTTNRWKTVCVLNIVIYITVNLHNMVPTLMIWPPFKKKKYPSPPFILMSVL